MPRRRSAHGTKSQPEPEPLLASEIEGNDQLIGISAPVLIGFGVTAISLAVANADEMRWPDAAMAALLLAMLSLVFAMQSYLRGRSHLLTNEEIAVLVSGGTDENRLATKHAQDAAFRKWSTAARFLFNVGVASLFLGIACIVLPPGPIDHLSGFRIAAVVLGLIGFVGEAAWGIAEGLKTRRASVESRRLAALAPRTSSQNEQV